MSIQILGPLRLWRGDTKLDAGPPQQAYLLALLLARAGQPVSTDDLIDLIWGEDAPATALNVVQKYVGALRRLLEPDLPARETGSYLRRQGNSYLFVADARMLDLVTFRELADAARVAVAAQRHEAAFARYLEALELWRGAVGDGFAHGPAAMSIFAGPNGEFIDSCVAAAELAVSLGRPERVLPSLRMAAAMAPLHEPVQASLVSVLGAVGRQAEALSVFDAVRTRLADELGLDPGPALQAAHRQPLNLTAMPPAASLVGRIEELTVLQQAVTPGLTGGTGLVLVEGEPGVGKTRLLEQIAAEADQRGAFVVWGRCLEGDGAPSMWPWVQVVGAILDDLPAAARQEWDASELGRLVGPPGDVSATPVLPDSSAQFRLFERAVALVGRVSARRPVVLFVDDLQWADTASLDLFGHLAARLPAGTAVVGALRDRAPVPGSELARMLAAASRLPGHRRIRLGPLNPSEVAELVRRETGQTPSPGAARDIYARTAGNPFFVRELSRLLVDGGTLTENALARAGLPATVRDVVRDRIAGLGDNAIDLLQTAALLGTDVDLALLGRAADIDGKACLDRLEPLEALGLLGPTPGDPYSFRFAHDLVRESVAETTSQRRVAQLHLRIADALEHTAANDELVAERLAHHLWAAGPLADPARTAAMLVRAGRSAATKSALEAAARQLRSAAQIARTSRLAELELSALSLLTAVDGMRAGYAGSAIDLLERAEHVARGLGREREAADFLFSRWAAYAQGIRLDRAGQLARQLLEQGEASADPIVRAYGGYAWGIHQWGVGNIGEAFRYLSQTNPAVLDDLARRGEGPLRRDLRLISAAMLAMMTALHGDVDAAWAQLDTMEAAAGDDPYAITVWTAYTARVAALIGDAGRARRAAQRGIAVDPEFSFAFLGSYQRLAQCWARAVTGNDPAGAAAEAQALIAMALADPPRSGLATWSGLLGEMWLAAGKVDEAAAALDRADRALDAYGQRDAEGLLLLLRARLLHARGQPATVVRAAAERARQVSIEREAHLFAHRAERFLTEF
ncbi:BTAD domain-containing putative transcriptional regulator [Actinomycetes bacterium KLBMP 9797]